MAGNNNHIDANPRRRARYGRKKLRQALVLLALGFALLLTAVLVIVPAFFSGTGAETADLLRTVFGPQPVALLESVSFRMQDALNRLRSDLEGGRTLISWSSQPQTNLQPTKIPSSTISIAPGSLGNSAKTGEATPSASPVISQAQPAPAPGPDVVADAPQIGWQAYGPNLEGRPLMSRALILLDPQRSYAGVALVRIDLSRVQLHIMPGYLEPSHSAQVMQSIPNLGMVPPADQPNLIAAFNGGFKALHGHYGMMAAGVPMLPPIPGLAAVAVYRDGHVQLGTWGQDLVPSPDMIAFRQNCPPLIQSGQLNPALSGDNRKAWGFTNNTDVTWRTGLGLTQDGHYLIYAVGNGTTAETLAQAFQQAGAYNAMQLDINQFYAHFYTYSPTAPAASGGFTSTGQRLLDQMINNPHLYLTPNPRDFFYLTSR